MNQSVCVRCAMLLAGTLVAAPVWAQPIPSGGPGGDHAPGVYPTTVTAANLLAELSPGGTLDGAGSNNIRLSFPSSGPIAWTDNRHNEGDISLSIGPRLPADPSFYPPNSFVEHIANDAHNSSQAWRVNQRTGALLASVRHNGVDNGDSVNKPSLGFVGTVGTIHGVAYFNQTGAQGLGYRMIDGVYSNGGEGSSDLQLGVAGYDAEAGEAVFSTAVAYFPYEQGWVGGWVNSSDNPVVIASSSPGLDPLSINRMAGTAQVTLSGVNSATDGMLFVAPTNDQNRTKIAAAAPSAGGWSIAVRNDENADVTGATLAPAGQDSFQFLYVPYSATNLIGGHIAGGGTSIHDEGGNQFDLVRTSAGTYELTVLESDLTTKRTESDGMLILSVADTLSGNPALADRTYLSYEYDSANQKFVIESRQTTIGGPSENIFGDNLALTDADFYFAWVDFEAAKTIALPSIPGDFDGNQQVDGDDLADWRDSFNVDGGADADGDGDSDGNDFLVWQQNVGVGVPGAVAVAAVPEPGAVALTLIGIAALAAARKRIG